MCDSLKAHVFIELVIFIQITVLRRNKFEPISQTQCDIMESLDNLSHAVAVAQHHDAVTGTEKQYVTEDYHYRIDKSVQDFLECASKQNNVQVGQYNCPLLNISQCDATENTKSFYVSVYNPLPRNRSSVIRVPITFNAKADVSRMVRKNF